MAAKAPVSTYSAEQVRQAEQPLLDSGEPLMTRAATALAGIVSALLERAEPLERSEGELPRILVLVGSGNNGADALYAVAQLAGKAEVYVLTLSSRWHEAALDAAIAAGARRITIEQLEPDDYDLVLDAILGIGTASDPALRGAARAAVQQLLPSVRGGRPRVIAVDIPSGLHPDTGTNDGVVLPASITATFGAVKQGMTVPAAAGLAGEVVLVRIGIEDQLDEVAPAGNANVSQVIDATGLA